MSDVWVAAVTVLGQNGRMGHYQLARGTKEFCEEAKQKKLNVAASQHPDGRAPEFNVGRIDIIPVERWEEIKRDNLL